MRQEWRYATDRPRAGLAVVQGEVAFGGRVVLEDLRDAEALLEGQPHVCAQAVAAGEPQQVARLLGARRRLQQVAAQLADVLKESAALGEYVSPEAARGEAPPQHHRAAAD